MARTASACSSAAAWAARPMSARRSAPFLPKEHLLSYIESILRVYNLHGRRDNIHKARIKILVNQLGIDKFREDVEADWEATHKDAIDLPATSATASCPISRRPICRRGRSGTRALEQRRMTDPAFANWLKHNVRPHRVPGYVSVVDLAERAGPHAGRRQLGPDGVRCRSRRALQPQRGAGELHAEPHPAARRALRSCVAVYDGA